MKTLSLLLFIGVFLLQKGRWMLHWQPNFSIFKLIVWSVVITDWEKRFESPEGILGPGGRNRVWYLPGWHQGQVVSVLHGEGRPDRGKAHSCIFLSILRHVSSCPELSCSDVLSLNKILRINYLWSMDKSGNPLKLETTVSQPTEAMDVSASPGGGAAEPLVTQVTLISFISSLLSPPRKWR